MAATSNSFPSGLSPRAGFGLAVLCVALAGCSGADKLSSTIDPKYGVSASPRVVQAGEDVPKGGGAYKVGKPYKVAGRTYVPSENTNYKAEGQASWYGWDFHGRLTANGEVFDQNSISAAHTTLPMPCYVRVTNLKNNRSIIVRVNNRGPFHGDRILDVSYKTADLLGFAQNGVAKVRVEYVGRAPIEGSDDKKLMASLSLDGTPAQMPSNSAIQVASAKPFVPALPSAVPVNSGSDVPLPLQRPYDLGHSSAPEEAQTASASPASPPVRSASLAISPAASGWSSGPGAVSGLGYAGVPGR